MSLDSQVSLHILPGVRSYFDQPVHLKVTGLTAKQTVELRSRLTDDKGIIFRASATYCSDINGEIDLDKYPSMGGTYNGTQGMGLFTSMRSVVPHHKLFKQDASTPILVYIELIRNKEVLAEQCLERCFMAEGVQKVPLENNDGIVSTLFLPPGAGPFPGILDLYIYGGGLNELRASLLANKGFVTMALAYSGHKDLPKVRSNFDLEYFEKAVTLLRMHPKVMGPDIGILSISKGGELALAISAFLPGVAATVFINGCIANTIPLHYRDKVIPSTTLDRSKAVETGDGVLDVRDVTVISVTENKNAIIPIEHAKCHFLFVASEDDRNWNSDLFVAQAVKCLQDHGKQNFEVVRYHKAGHFLEVPYMPHCPTTFHPPVGAVVVFGGEPKAHAEAQVDLWQRVQDFFMRHLNNGHSDFKAML